MHRDKPSLQPMIASATASSLSGTERPRVRAACVPTRSNLFDCTTRQIRGVRALEEEAGIEAKLMEPIQNVESAAHRPGQA